MTAQEAEIYPWTESNPAERLSEEGSSTGLVGGDARTAWFEVGNEMENFTYHLWPKLCTWQVHRLKVTFVGWLFTGTKMF